MKILEFRLFQGAACVPGDDKMRSTWRAPEFSMSMNDSNAYVWVRRGEYGKENAVFHLGAGVAIYSSDEPEARASSKFEQLVSRLPELPQTGLATASAPKKSKTK